MKLSRNLNQTKLNSQEKRHDKAGKLASVGGNQDKALNAIEWTPFDVRGCLYIVAWFKRFHWRQVSPGLVSFELELLTVWAVSSRRLTSWDSLSSTHLLEHVHCLVRLFQQVHFKIVLQQQQQQQKWAHDVSVPYLNLAKLTSQVWPLERCSWCWRPN